MLNVEYYMLDVECYMLSVKDRKLDQTVPQDVQYRRYVS